MWEKLKEIKSVKGTLRLLRDLKPMTMGQRIEHLWMYYKEYLLVVILVISLISLVGTIIASRNRDVLVSGMMVNVYMEQEGVNYLTTDYAAHLGSTSSNQVAELDKTGFGDMLDPANGQDSYYAAMMLSARVTGQMLDYMLLDKFAMEYYITQEVYQDLRETFTAEELATLEAEKRVIYARQDGQEERWPIAIIITDTAFAKDNINNEGDVYFALSGNSPRPEMCRHAWEYINAWESKELEETK